MLLIRGLRVVSGVNPLPFNVLRRTMKVSNRFKTGRLLLTEQGHKFSRHNELD